MRKQKVLDVLNNLEVFEQQGGEDAYMLVEINDDVLNKLEQVGVSEKTVKKYGDDETFCILAFAFGEGYANDYVGQLVYEYQEDIHSYFGLSYATHLVIPRSVLQSMPEKWQYNFVKLLNELDDTNWRDLLPEGMYKVEYRDYGYESNEETEREEFTWKDEVIDPLLNYDRGRRNIFI
ncbi:hypothetical protein [Sediminibacillus albus]|uniref:Uncharacterized protein n=1 Tax=Sediminibacillus albus TaxID=407036 RepID=A0A1G9C7D6_9BACI|nr:hypothetical protein [Sediminibacillus albus]SDK47578.1 hypothetical protein SAMN05216243_3292 [Sediminibacillus albus]